MAGFANALSRLLDVPNGLQLPQGSKQLSSKPDGYTSVWFQRRQHFLSVTSFGVHQHASMLLQMAKFMRFDLVLFLLGIVSRHFSAVIAPRPFDYALFPEEVSAFQCAFFIGGFEDQTIAEIQSEDARFFATERWNERGRGLCCGNNCCLRFANHVDAIVVAHPVLACGDETLRFIGPED